MIKFFCKFYFKMLDILAFGLLIIAAVLGYEVFDSFRIGYPVIGVFAGIILGLILEALVFPPLAILFSIDERIQKIEKTLAETAKTAEPDKEAEPASVTEPEKEAEPAAAAEPETPAVTEAPAAQEEEKKE